METEETYRNIKKVVSYKDKLIGSNRCLGVRKWYMNRLGDSGIEELDLEEKDRIEVEAIEDPTCPMVRMSLKERRELWKPWKLVVIVKLLGKCLGMRFLKLKL